MRDPTEYMKSLEGQSADDLCYVIRALVNETNEYECRVGEQDREKELLTKSCKDAQKRVEELERMLATLTRLFYGQKERGDALEAELKTEKEKLTLRELQLYGLNTEKASAGRAPEGGYKPAIGDNNEESGGVENKVAENNGTVTGPEQAGESTPDLSSDKAALEEATKLMQKYEEEEKKKDENADKAAESTRKTVSKRKSSGTQANESQANGSQTNESQANGSQANESQANGSQANESQGNPPPPKRPRPKTGKVGHRPLGKRQKDLSQLTHVFVDATNPEELDAEYGKGVWRIKYYHVKEELEHEPEKLYVKVTAYPVVEVKETDHEAKENGARGATVQVLRSQPLNCLIKGSLASASLMSSVLANKYSYSSPLHREANKIREMGYPITDSTLTQWAMYCTQNVFFHVACYFRELLLEVGYCHCDETYATVVNNGRPPGTKSYYFAITTSELATTNPIMSIIPSETRGKNPLREYFRDCKKQVVSVDCYSIYPSFEEDMQGLIMTVVCMMHIRRPFKQAEYLLESMGMPEEMIEASLSHKALNVIQKIYKAEDLLKDLSSEERTEERKAKIKPLFDEFFDMIRNYKVKPTDSDKLRQAITYALNAEERMRRYLYDGNIPLDNGYVERQIRDIALGRKNCYFSYSLDGADMNGVLYGINMTARANGAIPRIYMYYILVVIAPLLDTSDRSWFPMMTPWSDEYRAFEVNQLMKERQLSVEIPGSMLYELWPERAKKTYAANIETGRQSEAVREERAYRRENNLPVFVPKKCEKEEKMP